MISHLTISQSSSSYFLPSLSNSACEIIEEVEEENKKERGGVIVVWWVCEVVRRGDVGNKLTMMPIVCVGRGY